VKAARLSPKVCAHDQKRWEDWIFVFAEKHQLQVSDDLGTVVATTYFIAGYNPFCADRISKARSPSIRDDACPFPNTRSRGMQITLTRFSGGADRRESQTLLRTVKEWPREIYDIAAVIEAVRAELDKAASTSSTISSAPGSRVLMECLAEL
jgi:hypothetical protein